MAIAFDNSSVGHAEATDSLTFSHTCTGTDLSLIVVVAVGDATVSAAPLQASSVTYNGTALTFAGRASVGFGDDEYNCEIWYLDDPATGANDVVITLDESIDAGYDLHGIALSYTGAGNGIGANVGTGNGNSSAPSVTFNTGASSSWIVAGITTQTGGITQTPGAGITEREEGSSAGTPTISYWAGDLAASGGSDTVSTTQSASRRWSMVAIELLEGGAASPVTVSAAPGVAAVSGQQASISPAVAVSAAPGVVSSAGPVATMVVTTTIVASAAAVSVTGNAATVVAPVVVAAAPGVGTPSGVTASIGNVVTVEASVGVAPVSGPAVTIVSPLVAGASAAVVTVLGPGATIAIMQIISAGVGVVTVRGQKAIVDTVRYVYDLAVTDEALYTTVLADDGLYDVALQDAGLYVVALGDASRA